MKDFFSIKKAKDPLDEYEQKWLLEDMMEDESFAYRKMFGGMSCYLHGLMVLYLAEDEKSFNYNRKRYKFPLWNGLLFPMAREHHESVMTEFPCLIEHPVLPKWLYLPLTHEKYEDYAPKLISLISKNDPRFGIIPGTRKGKGSGKNKKRSPRTKAARTKHTAIDQQ